MNWKNTTQHYGSISIALHWLMALLIVAVYLCMELRGYFPKGSMTRELLKIGHFSLGLSVLALVAVRLWMRLSAPKPLIQPAPSKLQMKAASLTHWMLYGFMIGMPIAGWLILSAAGKPIPFFGLEVPALIGKNPTFARQIKDIHETVAEFGYYFIGLHAAVALLHHYILRDNTFTRILPQRKSNS